MKIFLIILLALLLSVLVGLAFYLIVGFCGYRFCLTRKGGLLKRFRKNFDKHLQKVLLVLGMTSDELLFYSANMQPEKVETVYSLNAPTDYVMSEKVERQYSLLMDVLDLCTIYY